MRLTALVGGGLLLFFTSLYASLPSRWLWSRGVLWRGFRTVVSSSRGNAPAGGIGWTTRATALVVVFAWSQLGWFSWVVVSRAWLGWTTEWFHLHSGSTWRENSACGNGLTGVTQTDLLCLLLVGVVGYFTCQVHHYRTHTAEQFLLVRISVVAGVATRQTDNLVGLYLNLELQALALYTLVGYHKERPQNRDAALRYLLAGSLVSARTLFGFVRLYQRNGSFCVGEFRFEQGGSIWVVGRLLFKLGAFPFYFWTPPVYEPLDWATLLVVVGPAKINLWYLLVSGLAPVVGQHHEVLLLAGRGSIRVGAIGGYFQTSVTSLLAYSSIINAGYLLLLAGAPASDFNFRYYLARYLASTVAVVVVLSLFDQTRLDTLSTTVGLGGGTPLLRYYLAINLAGLPVFPGFFGKLYLVQGILAYGRGVTVVVVLLSIVPAVYYVGLAVGALFTPKTTSETAPGGRWTALSAGGILVVFFSVRQFIRTVM